VRIGERLKRHLFDLRQQIAHVDRVGIDRRGPGGRGRC
jgi:hypothetical protein